MDDHGIDVSLELVARGLDGREVRRPWGHTLVAAGSTQDVVIPISALPIQSVGTQSSLTVSLQFDQAGLSRERESAPLLYSFRPTYSLVDVLGEHGLDPLGGTPEEVFGVDANGRPTVLSEKVIGALDNVASAETQVAGRLWDGSGWIPLSTPNASFVGSTVAASGHFGQILEDWIGKQPPAGSMAGGLVLCPRWRTSYVDEGFAYAGASEAVQSDHGTFPARFARAYLHRVGEPNGLFSGHLDQDGCARLAAPLPDGAYSFWLTGRMERPDGVMARVLEKPAYYAWTLDGQLVTSWDYPLVYAVSFKVVDGVVPAGLFSPDFASTLQGVAATYGQILVTPNNGLIAGPPYEAYSNERCPSPADVGQSRRHEACFDPQTKRVFIGRDYGGACQTGGSSCDRSDGIEHNANWKFVVAHEIGHQVQERIVGAGWHFEYNRPASAPLLCQCTNLNPTGNEVHCLQSTEDQGAAQVEGYGQFYASLIWNDPSLSTCTFTYYKRIRNANYFLTVDAPPTARSCLEAVRWTENHCPTDDRASEMDWMGFYTSLGRASTGAISQAALAGIYKRLCSLENGGTYSCGGTKDERVRWSDPSGPDLPEAALLELGGSLDARYLTFTASGDAYGVTR